MVLFKFILLGIVQGFTEFLPVSSSGHLVIFGHFLKLAKDPVLVAVILHLGTLTALLVFFAKDIKALFKRDTGKKTLFYILVITFITGIIGISGRAFFESLFESGRLAALSLFFMGIILVLTRTFLKGRRSLRDINIKDALLLGFMQAFSIIPGISRSGITISALLFRKVEVESAFRFSFLASIPAIIGATILEISRLNTFVLEDSLLVVSGFLAAFLSGLLALKILLGLLQKAKFWAFGFYCLVISFIFLLCLN